MYVFLAVNPAHQHVYCLNSLAVLQCGENYIRLWPEFRAEDCTVSFEMPLKWVKSHTPRMPSRSRLQSVFAARPGDPPHAVVLLPDTYLTSSAPQLQLLSNYIGDLGVDHGLFVRKFIITSPPTERGGRRTSCVLSTACCHRGRICSIIRVAMQ
jgi:hypothetical protein